MSRIQVRDGFLVLMAALWCADESGVLPIFLLAAAVHECGHLFVIRLSGGTVHALCLTACGAVLRDQARFCDLCGVPLEGAVPVSRPKAQKGGIAAGQLHTVAFRADGKVLATGNNDFGQCDVSGWSDVVGVACGKDFTVAVCADGTALRWRRATTSSGNAI